MILSNAPQWFYVVMALAVLLACALMVPLLVSLYRESREVERKRREIDARIGMGARRTRINIDDHRQGGGAK